MKVEVGDIIFAHRKRFLVVFDAYDTNAEYQYFLINLDNFEIHNAYTTLESLGNSFKIDKVLNKYEITMSK